MKTTFSNDGSKILSIMIEPEGNCYDLMPNEKADFYYENDIELLISYHSDSWISIYPLVGESDFPKDVIINGISRIEGKNWHGSMIEFQEYHKARNSLS